MRSGVLAPGFGSQKVRRAVGAAAVVVGLVVGAGLAPGCHPPPQRPFVFNTPTMAREPVEALTTAMRETGHPAVHVDGQQGIVRGRWDDTGQRSKPLNDRETTVIRRFTAKLDRGRFGNEVTLSSEVQRCVINAFTLTETDVTGTCEPLDRLPPEAVAELKRVGSRLEKLMQIP